MFPFSDRPDPAGRAGARAVWDSAIRVTIALTRIFSDGRMYFRAIGHLRKPSRSPAPGFYWLGTAPVRPGLWTCR